MTPLPNSAAPRRRSATPRDRVVVAMSGGVDSSLAAALLLRSGHEVIGITLQLYDHGAAIQRKGTCCAGQDIHDARRVAERLGIPHYVLDYERQFKLEVMQPFASSYVAGETPIPCVLCNQRIKFRDLLGLARELGAAALATGHYIERRDGARGPELYRAADTERDQSYFLFATTREQLRELRFPLGGMRKSEVRALAGELQLPVAQKPDSQDICFVPTGRYTDVIARLNPAASGQGEIVHIDGTVLGRHEGVTHFTVGQRKGLRIARGDPLYVIRLNAQRRQVVVGPKSALATTQLGLREVNWLGAGELTGTPPDGLPVHVRVRSTQAPQPARLFASGENGTARVELQAPEAGIARGQACVFYETGDPQARVLGGGWIAATAISAMDAHVSRSAAAG